MPSQFNNLQACASQAHYLATGEVRNPKHLAWGGGVPHKKRINLQCYPPKKIKNAPLSPVNLAFAHHIATALLASHIPVALPTGSRPLQSPHQPPLERLPRKRVRPPPPRSNFLNRQTAHNTALLKLHRCCRKLARCRLNSRLSEELIQPLINAMNDVIQYHPELIAAINEMAAS
jgi:hypothetical protein